MLLGFAFDGIELADTLHNLMREARRLSGFGDLEVAAPRVRQMPYPAMPSIVPSRTAQSSAFTNEMPATVP